MTDAGRGVAGRRLPASGGRLRHPIRVVRWGWPRSSPAVLEPWPNAETLRLARRDRPRRPSRAPLFALAAIRAWECRRDGRAARPTARSAPVFLLALHMIFVSSIRYRIPGSCRRPGLAAVGWRRHTVVHLVGSAVRTCSPKRPRRDVHSGPCRGPGRGRCDDRVRKVVGWVLLLLVAVAVGGGSPCSYVPTAETLRAAIREGAPRFLPGCQVDVQQVQVRPLAGRSC